MAETAGWLAVSASVVGFEGAGAHARGVTLPVSHFPIPSFRLSAPEEGVLMHATGKQLDAEGEGVSGDGIAGPDYVCEMAGFTASPSPPLTLSPRCCNSWFGVFCAPALKQHIQYNTRNRPVSAGSESWWSYMVGRRDGDELTPSPHPQQTTHVMGR